MGFHDFWADLTAIFWYLAFFTSSLKLLVMLGIMSAMFISWWR